MIPSMLTVTPKPLYMTEEYVIETYRNVECTVFENTCAFRAA